MGRGQGLFSIRDESGGDGELLEASDQSHDILALQVVTRTLRSNRDKLGVGGGGDHTGGSQGPVGRGRQGSGNIRREPLGAWHLFMLPLEASFVPSRQGTEADGAGEAATRHWQDKGGRTGTSAQNRACRVQSLKVGHAPRALLDQPFMTQLGTRDGKGPAQGCLGISSSTGGQVSGATAPHLPSSLEPPPGSLPHFFLAGKSPWEVT